MLPSLFFYYSASSFPIVAPCSIAVSSLVLVSSPSSSLPESRARVDRLSLPRTHDRPFVACSSCLPLLDPFGPSLIVTCSNLFGGTASSSTAPVIFLFFIRRPCFLSCPYSLSLVRLSPTLRVPFRFCLSSGGCVHVTSTSLRAESSVTRHHRPRHIRVGEAPVCNSQL